MVKVTTKVTTVLINHVYYIKFSLLLVVVDAVRTVITLMEFLQDFRTQSTWNGTMEKFTLPIPLKQMSFVHTIQIPLKSKRSLDEHVSMMVMTLDEFHL